MSKIWLIKSNQPSDWDMSSVTIDKGKLELDDWINVMSKKEFIKHYTIPILDVSENNDQSGNTVSLINTVTKCLNYKEGQHINTVNVYTHPEYTIQAMYIIDNDYSNSDKLNYFSTIVNIEKMQIYESAVFYKNANGLTIDVSLDEILHLLMNFYYVRVCKLSSGVFEKIDVNNYEPEIQKLFKTYHRKHFNDWIVLCEDNKMLEKLEYNNNDITQFDNLIWFKLKNYHGEINEYFKTIENNKTSDYRGIYMNIDEKIIKNFFF